MFIELASGGTNVGNDKGVSRFPWPSRPIHVLPITPREMNEEDIESQIEAYGYGAKLVKDSGLDGVDLHGTHGALISEFLSPLMNRRNDRWGGSLDNRMRFLELVIKGIRENVGSDIALGMRLIGYERFEGGNSPKDAAEIARRLDGKLDWITADQGYSPQQEAWQAVPMYVESGYNLGITDAVKSSVQKTKVCIVGKYVDVTYAESLIASGKADIVAMTRALIADPELPNKAMEGRIDRDPTVHRSAPGLLGEDDPRTADLLHRQPGRQQGKGVGHRDNQRGIGQEKNLGDRRRNRWTGICQASD